MNTITVRPGHLSLGRLIQRLEREEDPARVVPLGFHEPHSYRGYYEDLAFELTRDIRVGAMLAAARSALGGTYTGWKGGEYKMTEFTDCWLVSGEGDTGESIGAVLLELMLSADR